MGLHDLSTFIDEVLKKTGEKKLTYIGYSMGTTLSYMLLSSKPEYNDKVNLVVSIAPVSHVKMSPNIFIKGVISAVLVSYLKKYILYQLLNKVHIAINIITIKSVYRQQTSFPTKYFHNQLL